MSRNTKISLLLVLLLIVHIGATAWAFDCKPTITLESVLYQGETVGAGGQKVDQFAVRWGATADCGCCTGRANVTLKIKRITREETASATNIDSSRTTGNLINLTIPREATDTDPRSWTVTIVHTSLANSTRSLRASGLGNPDLSTATIGQIPGGPIGRLDKAPTLLQAGGSSRNEGVVPGVWRPDRVLAHPELLQVQVTRPTNSPERCFHGSINVTGLTAPSSNLVKIDWQAIPPSCEKVTSINLKAEFTRQDGTKQTPATAVSPSLTSFTFGLTSSSSPIASYFIDIIMKSQFDPINGTTVTITQAGNF